MKEKLNEMTYLKFSADYLIPHELGQNKLIVQRTAEALYLKLEAEILAEKLQDTEQVVRIEVPATWWDMFKQQHFPEWLLKHFPVRYKIIERKVRFQRYATYPRFKGTFPGTEMVVIKEFVTKT